MTNHEGDRAGLLARLGLRTEALGPPEEWSPSDPATYQRRHDQFWRAILDIVPDDDADEPFWMTSDASTELMLNAQTE